MPIAFNVKIAISVIFAAATLACHFTSSHHLCLPPLLPRALHACMRVGGGSFQLCKQSASENETKFDYRLITG